MNKFITKLAKLTLGLALASGVVVAIETSNQVKIVDAANSSYQKVSSLSAGKEVLIVSHSTSGQYYLMDAVTGATSAGPKYITCSLTNGQISGDYDSHLFTVSASSTNWKFATGTKYLKWSSTSSNTALRINTGDSSNTFTYDNGTLKFSSATRYVGVYTSGSDWRSYNSSTASNYSGTGSNIEFYEKASSPQTITASSDSAYSDESITLTTNAASATWSITSGSSYAHLSSTSGKSVSLIGDAAGSVTVKAVASGYTDVTKTVTFTERPAGTYYDVTFDSNGGSSSPAKESIKENETFTFPSAGSKDHYSFLGWSSDGGTTKYAAGATSPAVVADILYTAYWQEDAKYNVTYAAGEYATGSYVDANQYVGSYTLLAFNDLSGIAYDSSVYRFKNYTVGGVDKNPGDSIILSSATTVTVNFEEIPLEYQIIFGTAEGTGAISDFSNSSYVIPSGVTLDNIQGNVYSNTSNQAASLRFGKSGTVGSFDATIGSSYYIKTVVCNLKYYGSDTTAAFDVTPNGGTAISKTLTSSFEDYVYDVSDAKVNKVTLGTSINGKRAYLSGFTIAYEAKAQLDSVTSSGQSVAFQAGNNFSYGGTLTAHYTAGKADAVVSPTSFKFGDSGIDPTSSGTVISNSTVLDVATHNGKYIYVLYAEEDITRYASYQISVSYAPVTSVVIDTHSAEIGLNETFDHTQVGVTVNSQYSDPGYEWIVSANTVSDDYAFDGSGLLSGDTEGTITLRCRSTADTSKYDELVVTVTGNPTANFTEVSVSGYVGKGASVAFTYGNIDDTSKISVSSSSAAVSVGTITAANENGSVAITFVSAGSATLTIHYDGGSALDSITVTVSADSVVALNWTASNINVYSGAVLPVAIEDTWMVNYEMASGDTDFITSSDGDYTVKLGGSTISLPHTWAAEDDGKALCVEYMGFESSTVSVSVTQSLRPIMAAVPGESAESNLTFTAKAEGSGTADDGKSWTVTSDGTESNFDATKGIHFGTSSGSVQYIKLTSSDFTEGTITKVVVNASTASGVSATAGVKVNGVQFGGEPQSLSSSAGNYTFTGSASAGEIEVEITKPSSATKAIYCKSIVVTYQTASGESVDIANVVGHEAAQKAVVKFAKAFNVALGATENCTTGLSSAWSSATSAWNTFLSEASALGSSEEAYAKNLVKYATAQWTEGTDSDYSYCLERALATYEACVSQHGQEAFMSAVRTVSSARVNSISLFNGENNSVAIIVIISMVSMTTIGAFFFIRKRKENI